MKAWDTNLLVRHLAEDDVGQLRVVRRELERASSRGQSIWIADVTLVETLWVLQHGFGLEFDSVLEILLRLTEDARFVLQSGGDVRLALERSRNKGDLPEHLIALAAKQVGAEKTQTFDRAVKGFPEFQVL
ncbi:MAG: PIN domain-containing protein [Verrucomicrobiota bacterium]